MKTICSYCDGKRIASVLLMLVMALSSFATDIKETPVETDPDDLVIVNGDTISMILPERNFGRYDRGLYNFLYIPKGAWAFGLTASYGEFNSEDMEILSVIKDFNFKGKMYSIKPSVSYFFRHNQSIGFILNYTRGKADLASLAFDLDDEDLNFNIHDVSYYTESYSLALSYRNYVGLGREKRFAVFNQVDLGFGSGSSRFKRYYSEELRDTRSNITTASLNFSPGLCMFIQDHVSFNVSFGVFGLNWKKISQKTNGVEEGTRTTSGANFRFNIFNINFGLSVVI